MAGQTFAITPGRTRPAITIPVGRPVNITIGISSPTGAAIKDVYLAVKIGGATDAPVPTGQSKILIHHAGTLESDKTITTTWIPETLFGTNELGLTLDYTIGKAGTIGTSFADLTLTT